MLRNISKYHIDMDVKGEDGFQWRFIGVYGEAQHGQKHKTWEDLRNLRVTPIKPWLCAGDFNEVLAASEQFGGLIRPERQMDGFLRNEQYSLLAVMSELPTVRCDRVLVLWLQVHGRRVSMVSCRGGAVADGPCGGRR